MTPDYKRINVEVPGEPVTAHIESVRYGSGDYKGEYDIVDGDYETSWVRNDWDSGATYYDLNKAPIVSFDGSYEMDTFVVIPDGEQPYSYRGSGLLLDRPERHPGQHKEICCRCPGEKDQQQ